MRHQPPPTSANSESRRNDSRNDLVNYSNYANTKIDEMLAATAATADSEARLKMMAEAPKITMDE